MRALLILLCFAAVSCGSSIDATKAVDGMQIAFVQDSNLDCRINLQLASGLGGSLKVPAIFCNSFLQGAAFKVYATDGKVDSLQFISVGNVGKQR